MISVGLTQFMTFANKPFGSRSTFVRNIKNAPEYSPMIDYWKKLRDSIKKFHEDDLPLSYFDDLVDSVPDRKKSNFRKNIRGYKHFLSRYHPKEYFSIPRNLWTFNDRLSINASPEIGLIINNKRYGIKLYFKGQKDALERKNISIIFTLMQSIISPECDYIPVILNLSDSKILQQRRVRPNDDQLNLDATAQSFLFIYDNC